MRSNIHISVICTYCIELRFLCAFMMNFISIFYFEFKMFINAFTRYHFVILYVNATQLLISLSFFLWNRASVMNRALLFKTTMRLGFYLLDC